MFIEDKTESIANIESINWYPLQILDQREPEKTN